MNDDKIPTLEELHAAWRDVWARRTKEELGDRTKRDEKKEDAA